MVDLDSDDYTDPVALAAVTHSRNDQAGIWCPEMHANAWPLVSVELSHGLKTTRICMPAHKHAHTQRPKHACVDESEQIVSVRARTRRSAITFLMEGNDRSHSMSEGRP